MEPDRALISGEGVRLDLTRAGVGSRVIAAAVDVAIQALALIVLLLIDVVIAGSADDASFAAVSLVEVVLVLAGYPIVAEWLGRGRTVGKVCMGLRVVRDDGGPIGLRQALVRGLAGLILEKPGLLFPLTTIAGVLTISLSGSEKRIGDMMAGTVVLNERAGDPSVGGAMGIRPIWVPPALQPWAAALDLHRLDDNLALRVRQFVSRVNGLTPAAQVALGDDLARRVLAVVVPPPPPGTPTPFVLTTVLAERTRRAAQPAPAYAAQYPPAAPYPQTAQYPPATPYPPTPWARPSDAVLDADADSPFAPPR